MERKLGGVRRLRRQVHATSPQGDRGSELLDSLGEKRIERIDGILCNPALNQGARLAADVFRIGFGMFHVKHSRGTSPSGSADKNVSRETSIASFPQLSR